MTFKENSNRNYGPRPPWAGTACLCPPPPPPPPDLDSPPSTILAHLGSGSLHKTESTPGQYFDGGHSKDFLCFVVLVSGFCVNCLFVFGGCYFLMCAHIVVSLLAFTGFDLLY